MRVKLAIALMFVAGSLVMATAASKERNYPHFFKHRTKLREIRGFKPEYISTAIGFGKRDEGPAGPADLNGREKNLLSALRNLPSVIMSADALLRMIQTNPVVGKLTQLSIQNDQGGQEKSMTEPARPGRTFALF